jgi:hypothetical protein
MDPAGAALIGAGVGASVAVGAQFLSHALTVKRDRRNQKRERLHSVVTEAALAIYGPSRDERVPWDEWKQRERHPESRAALDPHLVRDVEPSSNRSFDGITLLMVHFGSDHWLVDSYVSTSALCLKAEEAWSDHTRNPDDQRLEQIPNIATVKREAQEARNQ